MAEEVTFTELVGRARDGDQGSWDTLVDRLANMVWSVTQSYGLNEHDAVDVSQMTWLQLARQIDHVRDPERIGLWMATTTRRECLRFVTRRRRLEPVDPAETFDSRPAIGAQVEDSVFDQEERRALWRAIEKLPAGCRALLHAFLADPEPSYAEIAAAMGMPVGSVGPRRQRCLAALRALLT